MMIPLEQALGWGRSELQAAIHFALSLGTIVAAQLAGWLNLKFGLRIVTILSLIALSISLVLLTQVKTTIWSLYLGYFLVPLSGFRHLADYLVPPGESSGLWKIAGWRWPSFSAAQGSPQPDYRCWITWSVSTWNWQAGFIALSLLPVLIALPLTLLWLLPG